MFCNICTWGGRRRRSAVAVEAMHLGRSVWGEAHRSRRRERGPRRRGARELAGAWSLELGAKKFHEQGTLEL